MVALYEKGALRADIELLMKRARANGFYVIGVNTRSLSSPAIIRLADLYIERFNFGRDFGSYKAGIAYIARHFDLESCPRLVMCNDSVFYASRGLDKFLKDMKDPEPDVLGATENYEIQTHLGSFFVSLAGDILRNPRFQRYWKRYRRSDVRTSVIFRGEMGLSKALTQCGATPAQMAALYDSTHYYNALDETDVLNASIQLAVHQR